MLFVWLSDFHSIKRECVGCENIYRERSKREHVEPDYLAQYRNSLFQQDQSWGLFELLKICELRFMMMKLLLNNGV